jgi:hypothetical protein
MRSKKLKIYSLLVLSACALLAFTVFRKEFISKIPTIAAKISNEELTLYSSVDTCRKAIDKLSKFAAQNNCNENLFFILDLEVHSGKKRFFVFDNKQDSILASGMVAQGQGTFLSTRPTYSNIAGSYCSSKGIYIVGERYNGRFGLAFKLYGNEASNSNAFKRFVVLHAHDCIPDSEVYPKHICQSQGCPTVSQIFLSILNNYIQDSKKKIVLIIR